MNRLRLVVAGVAAVLSVTSANAQKTTAMGAGNGGSPHMRSDWTVSGANISISYGRPSLKGRPEAQMMPVKMPWRIGADEASIIKTDKALKFGSVTLQPGSYTLNAEPGDAAWTLMIGKLESPKQWGIPYQPALEIGRVPMKLSKNSAPVEMVTFAIDPAAAGGTLKIEWGTKSASVPFSIAN